MEDKRRRWINAAKILGNNINAKVICPECGIGALYVKDELIPHWKDKLDRYMICNYCGKYNILTNGNSTELFSFKR